jgi:hypothetical protein
VSRCAKVVTLYQRERDRSRCRDAVTCTDPRYAQRRCCRAAEPGSRWCVIHPGGGIAWWRFYRWEVWRKKPVFAAKRRGVTAIKCWRWGWHMTNFPKRGERKRRYKERT